jgi:hypothetical protein
VRALLAFGSKTFKPQTGELAFRYAHNSLKYEAGNTEAPSTKLTVWE